MRLKLLDLLACPSCRGGLSLSVSTSDSFGGVKEGTLSCVECDHVYRIEAGIPRFVTGHSADSSFGYQWNLFRKDQLDSANGAALSAKRLWSETAWQPPEMAGRRVLDIGCGAGRFLEVMAATGCYLVGVDVSIAIDAAAVTVRGRDNVDLIQADVYHLPFKLSVFDDCYFIGVAQHTPDPATAIRELPPLLKVGGRLAISMYERRPWTRLNGKYLVRPLTRRMNKKRLLAAIRGAMPALFPVTEVLFRLPLVGRFCAFFIPVANYVEMRELSYRQRYELAVLDTFDRLAPQFDYPLTCKEVMAALAGSGICDLRRLEALGVTVVGRRGEQ